MAECRGKIWIDLDNAPHVPFFKPIIGELEKRGYQVWVTASGRYQVSELATMHGIPHLLLKGGYLGKKKLFKALGMFRRAFLLLRASRHEKPDLALSHGSRSQVVAANAAGIPVVFMTDYEYANFFFLRVDSFITPAVIATPPLHSRCRDGKYHGLKEDVYVPDFRPDNDLLARLGIEPGNVIVTVRPPATDAHYHNVETDALFSHIVHRIGEKEDAVMVILPRNERQRESVVERWPELVRRGKIVIPQTTFPGLSLIWESDLVISGGGTMNREAAALGVPVYSIFRGKIGAVDRYLCAEGRMTLVENAADADRCIALRKRPRGENRAAGPNRALMEIVDQVEAVLRDASPLRRRSLSDSERSASQQDPATATAVSPSDSPPPDSPPAPSEPI